MNLVHKLSLIALLIAAPIILAEETPANDPRPVNTAAEEKKADNTGRNARERVAGEKTPVDQNENKADLAITQKIRKAIVADEALSTYAHNIKIITQDGKVHLKGPVRTAEEKAKVEYKAAEIAGKDQVMSHIEIAPKDAK